MTKTALVIGGAHCVFNDIENYDGPIDGVVACNDVGAEYPGELTAWVSLHPDKFAKWAEKREANGHPPCPQYFGHRTGTSGQIKGIPIKQTPYMFPGQKQTGSSGLFALKVALLDLGFDRAVLAGIPMEQTPHFFDGKAWKSADNFRKAWLTVPDEYMMRAKSLSGWTSVLLGRPKARKVP